uniref:Uncharacterized protein n=1 Tax=viral metagenome TaxID=1070528 RepID=A0A2V0RAN3_9ZZZZ
MLNLNDIIEAVLTQDRIGAVVWEIADPSHEDVVTTYDDIPSYECTGCHAVWGRRWIYPAEGWRFIMCNACYQTFLARTRGKVRLRRVGWLETCLTDIDIELRALNRLFGGSKERV